MAKISGSFKSVVRSSFDPLGTALVRLGVSADAITVLGTVGVMVGAFAFAARGRLVVATIVVTLCALLDVLDGAMARASGRSSRFGALLDSVMDRVADASIFASLVWWFASTGQRANELAALICLVGGQLAMLLLAGVGVAMRTGQVTDAGADPLDRLGRVDVAEAVHQSRLGGIVDEVIQGSFRGNQLLLHWGIFRSQPGRGAVNDQISVSQEFAEAEDGSRFEPAWPGDAGRMSYLID